MSETEFPINEKSGEIVENGIYVVTLSSWQEFHQKALSFKSRKGYVWRGQKEDLPLNASFDRGEVKYKDQLDRVKKLKCHLSNFKEAMNKSYPAVLPQDDIDIWALGQHYGLKTPLLDWSLSPYIAAYFALIECHDPSDPKDDYRYVYALNRSIERLLSKRKKASLLLSKERSVPFIDKIEHPSPRFTAQKGIFTKAFHGNDIGKYVQSFLKKRPKEVIIVKFKIPTKDRDECLRELRSMNIDHTSIFLDLRDAVDRANSKL